MFAFMVMPGSSSQTSPTENLLVPGIVKPMGKGTFQDIRECSGLSNFRVIKDTLANLQ